MHFIRYQKHFLRMMNIRTSTENVHWFNERKQFQAGKGNKPKIPPTHTITDADYADDIAFLANTPAQAETLLHSLERATVGMGLHVNADKTEYMCFNKRGDISTRKGGPLKPVNKFIYLGSSVSSTEKKINTRLAKAWTAIDWLSVIWKSDLTDEIKRSFFPSSDRVDTAIWMHYKDAN